MALTLEQYVKYLETRDDLTWPAPPTVQPVKARPHLVRLPQVRAVCWNLYGTLLNVFSGSLFFEHPQKFVMDIALDKTVQEFKMWGSMYRKPGAPADYLREMYDRLLTDQRMAPSPGEKFPELHADKVWEGLVKKLLQKDYKWDTGFFGALNEYSRKIAYFFHASIQGAGCYAGASAALEHVRAVGLRQGLVADAQCFSLAQLRRGLEQQQCATLFDDLIERPLRSLSHEVGGRKPSERLFKHFLAALTTVGITPEQVLHVGSRLSQDIAPAKKLGMRTALFAGDKESLQATQEQLRDPTHKPDVLLTDLRQITEVVGA